MARRFRKLPGDLLADPDAHETRVLKRWQTEDTQRAVERARSDSPRWVFWEGPPTANGKPGIHHVFGRTIKDCVCRYQTMRGKRVDRKAGWDTHGLPVELEVEKQLGISGKKEIEAFGIGEFNARCRESVWKYREEWEKMSARIGYWLDYDSPYVTYADGYVESVWGILALMAKEDMIYRGNRVLPFCARCQTSLSSHELGQPGAYKEVQDPSVTVAFPLDNSDTDHFMVWTTTPWTLPSNVALAVNPQSDYVLTAVEGDNKRYWMAEALARQVFGKSKFEIVERKRGAELLGLRYRSLFGDAAAPEVDPGAWEPNAAGLRKVYPGAFVSMEDGTGIVHIAPAYGADDWQIAREAKLPVLQAVGANGRFTTAYGPVPKDTYFKDSNKLVRAYLREQGSLFADKQLLHNYPHCWRCEQPLLYFATPSWFVRTTAQRDRMLEYSERCNWVPPEVGERRFGEWLRGNVDWNISRSRYWGTPLPFWICTAPDCNHFVAIGTREELHARAEKMPEDFDFHRPSVDAITLTCDQCQSPMQRTSEVLDCWFDSGAMPFAQHHWPHGDDSNRLVQQQFPADFIAEGLDQTRGWFYSLLAVGTFMLDRAKPEAETVYRNCVVNGLLLDKNGVKMSKRLGNVVDPWDAIRAQGADAVRWNLVSGGALHLPKRFDLQQVEDMRRRVLGTLINTYQFFASYAEIDGYDPTDASHEAEPTELDEWLLSRTALMARAVIDAYETYDLPNVTANLEQFVSEDLSNWYVRRSRRRFWKEGKTKAGWAAYSCLYDALKTVTLLLAPICPFMAESLGQQLLGDGQSVHTALIEAPSAERVNQDLDETVALVRRISRMGRALRERARLRVRQPLKAVHLRCSTQRQVTLLQSPFAQEQILDELNVKAVGSLERDDGKICFLRVKPNFRVLGKKLGKQMKAAQAAIGELPNDHISQLKQGGQVALALDGGDVMLSEEDVQFEVEPMVDFDVESDGQLIVFLDAELDEQLVAEGQGREAISRINSARKNAGLELDTRIQLELYSNDDRVRQALSTFSQDIAEETLATSLVVSNAAKASGNWFVEESQLPDSSTLSVRLQRA